MDQFKIENFRRANPDDSFPFFRSLEQPELADIRRRLYSTLKLPIDAQIDLLVKRIDKLGEPIHGVSSDEADFNLRTLLSKLGIQCENDVFINWYKYDTIDQLQLNELVKYFEYIWYPSSDDIDLFDKSLTWVLSISHFGQVKIVRFS